MAEIRPFRAIRYKAGAVDLAAAIAPPYDVISAAQQDALYSRSPHNIIRLEYGEQRPADGEADNRYARAADELAAWRARGILIDEARPALYVYTTEFEWGGRRHRRDAYFGVVRLEEWGARVVRPHEHTLPSPKADRLKLLRATRTQISPIWAFFRERGTADGRGGVEGDVLYDFEAEGQRHVLSAISNAPAIDRLTGAIARADVYIADGHHRYETALAYRDEARAGASSWTGDEPQNFVMMVLTPAADPGLIVLPTHRIVRPPAVPPDALGRIGEHFRVEPLRVGGAVLEGVVERLRTVGDRETAFMALGLASGALHLLTLRDRAAVEALMPAGEPEAWKRLDVNVLQYGVLRAIYGVDEAALAAGEAVAYTQDAAAAREVVVSGAAPVAFLLNATPVDQIMAVADAGARMPQKSTYFYPKLPTGLVMYGLGH